MKKERIAKEDGRYLIYYTFTDMKSDRPIVPCNHNAKEAQISVKPADKSE